MNRALITGITGQDGSYLGELLLAKGYEVAGLVRSESWGDEVLSQTYQLYQGDLSSTEAVRYAVEDFEPSEIYNLAGPSTVQDSFGRSVLVGDAAGLGPARLIEAVKAARLDTRLFQASTSELFGTAEESPQTEETRFRPRSPYGAAKLYAHTLFQLSRTSDDLFTACGIAYNHESPRRRTGFVTRKISRSVARIAAGLETELALGNLDAQRDWGYAPEYVEAMWRVLQHDEPDDFILCTGQLHSVRDFCRVAFSHVGLDYADHVTVDPRFYRPGEEFPLVGDPSKTTKLLGWTAEKSFVSIVQQMVDTDVAALQQ